MDYYDDIKNVMNYIDMAKGCDASELVNKLSRFIKAKSYVLEIGMGPGNDLDLLKKKFSVTGSDKYKTFVDEYKSKNANADVLVLDAVSLDINRKFDAIYSNKVLMHLCKEDFELSIERQYELLNESGIVFHTLWKGDGEETFSGMLNVYYIEEQVKKLFDEKFEILLLESYAEFEEEDSILLVARKK